MIKGPWNKQQIDTDYTYANATAIYQDFIEFRVELSLTRYHNIKKFSLKKIWNIKKERKAMLTKLKGNCSWSTFVSDLLDCHVNLSFANQSCLFLLLTSIMSSFATIPFMFFYILHGASHEFAKKIKVTDRSRNFDATQDASPGGTGCWFFCRNQVSSVILCFVY